MIMKALTPLNKKYHYCLMILMICVYASGSSQTRGPQTLAQLEESPAGGRTLKLLDLINSEMDLSKENTALFTENYLSKKTEKGVYETIKNLHSKNGNLVLYSAERLSMYKYEMLVKSVHDKWFAIIIEIQQGPPFAIDEFEFNKTEPDTPPSEPLYISNDKKETKPKKLIIDKNAINKIDLKLTEMTKSGTFAGVAGVYKDWETVFVNAYGQSNKEKDINFKPATRFNIASLNKLFTMVAILKLNQEGKLKFSDLMKRYLPYMTDSKADKVTILHLLKHESGYGMYWDDEYFLANMDHLLTIESYMNFLKDASIAFDPGSKKMYSNTGYVLLGAIIEEVTGQTYYDYIQEIIFSPLNMVNTGYSIDFSDPNLAMGYTMQHEDESISDVKPNIDLTPVMGNSAGGGYSTLEDLRIFIKAWYEGKLLNSEMTIFGLTAFERTTGEPSGMLLGGGGPGTNAIIDYDPKNKLLVITLSNYDPPSAQTASKNIRDILFN